MIDGKYRARAKSTTLGFSKNETPGVEITFRFESGEEKTTTLWLSPNAQERSADTLKQMGFTGDDISIFLDCEDCSRLLPNEVELVVETEEFESDNGEIRKSQKIKYINTPGRSQVKSISAGQAASFGNRFKGLFTKNPAQQRQLQAPRTQPPSGNTFQNDDDDEKFPF